MANIGRIKPLIRAFLVRMAARLFYIFPIVQNRIVFSSHNGSQFSCNPKYIYEHLKRKYANAFQYIWIIEMPDEIIDLPSDIIIIKRRTFRYFYYHLTAKVIVTNIGKNVNVPIRKGTYLLETWHGGGAYKTMGKGCHKPSECSYLHYIRMKEEKLSAYISGCKKFSEMFSQSFFIPKTKALECGAPRNDMFFGDYSEITSKVREYYNIPKDKKIVLYAPTFRGISIQGMASSSALEEKQIDISHCLKALKKRFLGEFIFLSRMHHYIGSHTLKGCISVTNYPDMQELLCAADVLITDYSSSIWDYSLMGKPCFLYAPDLDEYDRDRGFYTPIEEWPGILSKNNESLIRSIENFDEAAFAQRIKLHHEAMGICETGRASQIVGEKIYEMCFAHKPR